MPDSVTDIKSSLVGTTRVGASTVLTPKDSLIDKNCEALEAPSLSWTAMPWNSCYECMMSLKTVAGR